MPDKNDKKDKKPKVVIRPSSEPKKRSDTKPVPQKKDDKKNQ